AESGTPAPAERDAPQAVVAPTDTREVTGEVRVAGLTDPLPFVSKDVNPMSLGLSQVPAGSQGCDTGTVEFRAVPALAVLPFEGPRVETAKASFMQAEAPAAETDTTGEVQVDRILRPATPFEPARSSPKPLGPD